MVGDADGRLRRGYWDCDDPNGIVDDSPFNTGLERIPATRSTNLWYGPQGGCYDFPRNANGIREYTNSKHGGRPASYRRCPWLFGGSQAPMTGGKYRKRARVSAPDAWPAYWDGRWFLADHAGANNLRHALLMDPATEFTGGQPIAADSLYGIIPTSLMGGNRMIDLDFGPDGALYVADYGGSTSRSATRTTRSGASRTSAARTHRGPDPQVAAQRNPASTTFAFNIGKSGGVSYKWDFSDGGTSTSANRSTRSRAPATGVRPRRRRP